MSSFTNEEKKEAIVQNYAKIATSDESCGCNTSGCCGTENTSLNLGYTKEQLDSIPEGANKGLGCGNPDRKSTRLNSSHITI